MEIKVVTDITTEPVLIAEMKSWMKFDIQDTTENTAITNLIIAAREYCEKYTNLTFAAKTIDVFFQDEEIIDGRMILPYGPHSSLTGFYRYDAERTETELTENSDFYRIGNQYWELRISGKWSDGVVSTYGYDYKARVVCGFGATGCENLPKDLATAIKHTVFANYRYVGDPLKYKWMMLQVDKILDKHLRNTWLGI